MPVVPSQEMKLADSIELIQQEILQLEALKQELHQQILDLVADADLGGAELAEIYWRFETIPASALEPNGQILRSIVRAHPYWSWSCTSCGTEVFITSRSDKRERERANSQASWLCQDCRLLHDKLRAEHYKAADVARQARMHQLATMPYRLYLQTSEWHARRLAALKRAAYRCQVCNRARKIQVHHRTYIRRGCELARDLIALCDQCHALYHGKGLLAEEPAS